MTSIDQLGEYVGQIETRLGELAGQWTGSECSLVDSMRYSLLAPGKRLRPALTMACAVACGGSAGDALDAGCAIEMVHCFSLIHDDLPAIDNDDLRRGQPTNHIVFGEATAILAGDALFATAFEIMGLSRAGLAGVLELARAVGVFGVVGGEALDVAMEHGTPSAEILSQIHRQKTGALFAASCAVGGMCASTTPAHLEALRKYGHALGLGFQIADDILDETASTEQLGKGAQSDARAGKLTYPGLYGLERSRRMAEEAVNAALDSIRVLPGPTHALSDLAQYSISRSK